MIFNLGGASANKSPTLDASYPKDVTVNVGENATFIIQISIDGRPSDYTYQWYVNGSAVSGATGSTYTRTGVQKGTYTVYCMVTNRAGSVKSRTATLTANRMYLFKNGDEKTSITGGWVAEACRPPDTSTSYSPTKTVSDGKMKAEIAVKSYGRAGVVRTSKAIDLSSYNTLYCNVTDMYNPEGKNCLGVMSTYGGASFSYLASSVMSNGVVSVDISGINSSYAVCIAIVCNRYDIYEQSYVTVDSIYVE